jgi:HlyD family secretion protein
VQLVFVVVDGTAKAVQVETGIQSDTHIEITSGISEGDVIVTGNYRAISQTLENNTPVLVRSTGEGD